MAITEEDIVQIQGLIRQEIESALSSVFLALRLEDFGDLMTPEMETRLRDVLANVECNAEKV